MLNNEVWMLVLGAGYSRRMGKQKLLLPINGEPMIRHIVKKTLTTLATRVVVVVNHEYAETQDAISDLPVVQLINKTSNMGMSTSLQIGIRYLQEQGATAAVVLLADQPAVSPETIDRVVRKHLDTDVQIVWTQYLDGPGHPVLFGQTLFDELLQTQGDQGARDVLRRHSEHIQKVFVQTACPMDIDTQEDYELILKRLL